MGHRMSSALLSRACALAFAFVIGLLAIAAMIPTANAMPTPNPIQPAAMTVTVVLDKSSYLTLTLDRGDYNPGEIVSAFYGVSSHLITNPSYAYEVDDTNAVIVLSGTTSAPFFSFRPPNPSSRSSTFHVTATDRGNTTQAQATISQAAGFVLGLSFDRTSYGAGETVHAHLTLTAKGTGSLPSQFRWSLSSASASATAITTGPAADLFLTIPAGTGNGGLLVFANELNTGASAFQTVQVGPTGSSFWSTDVGGVPVFAIVLSALFVLLLIAVIAMWRRSGGGFGPIGGKAAVPPPPPEGPVRSAPTSPMSITCRRCGKPIDLSTSRRPIEVMCPSCGETQVVT